MEENRLKAHLWKLKADLAPMTWPQRAEHLWTYYKWVLALAIGAALLMHVVISFIIAANTEILISGIGINVPVTDEGVACLSQDYLTRLGGGKRETVQYLEEVLDLENPALGQEASYSAIVKVSGMAATGSLDYLILDRSALEYYATGDLLLDLRQAFTEAEFQQLPILEVGGLPLLIDLTGTWFADTHIEGTGPYYLAFVRSSTRHDACRDLWHYLNTGK